MSEIPMPDAGVGARRPIISRIAMDAPWNWLAAGSRDMMRRPLLSLGYGLVFAAISGLLVYGVTRFATASLALALAGGFMLVGPMLAVGLYEISRRDEAGEAVAAHDIVLAARRAPRRLGYMGALLMLALLAWIRIATLVFALFWGTKAFPPLAEFLPALLFTTDGLALLVVGSCLGAVIALAVFAMSAVSVPMLLDRQVDAVTAMLTSIEACRVNFWPMLLWAMLIAMLTALGIATLMVGLVFTFPLVGHATWHAYRALVPR